MTELKMVLGKLSGDLALDYKSGIFMPSEKTFIENNWEMEWETEYVANGTLEGTYKGETLTAELSSSPVTMNWQVVSTNESLDVQAGHFDNLVKMNREISFDVSSLKAVINGNNINLSTTLTINTDLWYAPNVGLIKQDVNSASIKLFGISFPIDAWGYIELDSYTLNQE